MPEQIERSEGRRLFGTDPDAYDRARPDYPDWIFEDLVASGALFPGAATLEIGAGTGLATRHLIAHGANPLTLLEPDTRFADVLAHLPRPAGQTCIVRHEPFETAALAPGSFDLIVAATAFHWLEPTSALARARTLLKSGGTLALMWNVFAVPGAPDPFHDATASLLTPLATSPSGAADATPYPLDRAARESEARAAGFRNVAYRESQGSITLNPDGVVELYATFSSIQRLTAADRDSVLSQLRAIADDRFEGRVIRNVTICLYRFS
ncbi:MAG: class I SAM-dependent methyltransferase [Pseudomonadales bacterium]